MVFPDAHPTEKDLTDQANCALCRWHHIGTDAKAVVEAAHDHTMPGWRDLPVASSGAQRGSDVEQARGRQGDSVDRGELPREWQIPGAPTRTLRRRHGTQHVAGGGSPLRGYPAQCVRVFGGHGVAGCAFGDECCAYVGQGQPRLPAVRASALNTLLVQAVLMDLALHSSLDEHGRRGQSPAVLDPYQPYGRCRLDINTRLNLAGAGQRETEPGP